MDLRNKYRYARAFIVLLAALITLILNIKYKRDIVRSLIIMLIVIIIFYVIATVAIKLIDKIKNMDTKVQQLDDESEDEEHEDASEANN